MRLCSSLTHSQQLFNRLRADNEKLLSFPFMIEMKKLILIEWHLLIFWCHWQEWSMKDYYAVLVVDFEIFFVLDFKIFLLRIFEIFYVSRISESLNFADKSESLTYVFHPIWFWANWVVLNHFVNFLMPLWVADTFPLLLPTSDCQQSSSSSKFYAFFSSRREPPFVVPYST